MKKKLNLFNLSLVFVLLCSSCKRDIQDVLTDSLVNSPLRAAKVSNSLLELSYELTTYVDYKADFEKLSSLDLTHLNPKAEKQRVEMTLLPNGEIRMITENLNLEKPINLPHQTVPSDIPEIKRSEIIGSRISFYDVNGKLVGNEEFKTPKQTQLVDEIKKMKNHSSEEEIAEAIATMQGQVFIRNMQTFLTEARIQGAFVLEGERYVTVRQDLAKMGINQQGSCVTLIDMQQGKILGYTIYDEKENMIQKTYYRYHKKGVRSIANIQTEEIFQLPSGIEVSKITQLNFDNLVYKLNLQNIH
jgi:hypothetical protein